MRILTGDECGILKECLPHHKKDKLACLPTSASRQKGVVSLAWTTINNKDQECSPTDQQFASLHLDSTVTLWERSNETKRSFAKYHSVRDIRNCFSNSVISEVNRPLGLAAITNDRLVTCNTLGEATILKPLAPEPIVKRFSTISALDAKHPLLTCMAVDSQSNKLALGGENRETVLFDMESTKQLFKCKNLPPDPQTLLAPLVWPSCIEFMGNDDGNKFAVGSAYHQVRIYDARVARRPVMYTPDDLLEYRVTALCHDATHHEHELFVGDAAGTVLKLDLRALGRGTCKSNPVRYVGPAGSVRGLAVRENRLIAVGLDRMLRVFNVSSSKEEECIYLKQRVNCVLLGREPSEATSVDPEDGDIDQEDVVRDYVDSDQDSDEASDDDDDASTGSSDGVEAIDDIPVDSAGEGSSDEDDDDVSFSDGVQESDDAASASGDDDARVTVTKPKALPARKRQKR